MRVLTVAGGDLFRLALEHLGDATQWNRIAALNGLDDPVLDGLQTLRLPERDPNAGGGIERG
jgi:nucleoid-associated protein YgaU